MNYEQIKDQVLDTSKSLNCIPVQVIKQLMPEQWYHCSLVGDGGGGETLPDVEHPDINIVTHYRGYLEGNRYPYTIRSVLADSSTVPAFFYVYALEGEPVTQVYVVNLYQTRRVLRSIMELAVDSLDEYSIYIAELVAEGEEVHVYDKVTSAISRNMEPPKYEHW